MDVVHHGVQRQVVVGQAKRGNPPKAAATRSVSECGRFPCTHAPSGSPPCFKPGQATSIVGADADAAILNILRNRQVDELDGTTVNTMARHLDAAKVALKQVGRGRRTSGTYLNKCRLWLSFSDHQIRQLHLVIDAKLFIAMGYVIAHRGRRECEGCGN